MGWLSPLRPFSPSAQQETQIAMGSEAADLSLLVVLTRWSTDQNSGARQCGDPLQYGGRQPPPIVTSCGLCPGQQHSGM